MFEKLFTENCVYLLSVYNNYKDIQKNVDGLTCIRF